MTFETKPTKVPGVAEILIPEDAPYARENFVWTGSAGFGFPALISADGRAAVADSVIAAICSMWSTRGAGHAGLRFGPGGRRHYRFVTERLIETLMEGASYEPCRPSARQLERRANALRFVEDLIDLL